MYVSGFTFIRNALKLDYPVKEAIQSILPLCDEVIVAVGNSDDNTLAYIRDIGSDKIKIINTVWDDSLRKGGIVLARETDKALSAVNPKADWCVYVQGDECYHEKDFETIRNAMSKYVNDPEVEGLLFKYNHFYGSYDYLADSRRWYRKEIRIIRNGIGVSSWKDAQGFRIEGRKLKVKPIDAEIEHYGWVRPPDFMMAKNVEASKYWHSDEYIQNKFNAENDFDYSEIDSIKRFEGTHPRVMKPRIEKINWKFDRDPEIKTFGIKLRVLHGIEKLTGWRVGEHKNYKVI
ncbi:MAG: glycosyltransferase family 2 protein [Flavobacteriales bacterium]|nr:glycosyltransferase family 2 protein [Flavobacteriales bacterium]